MFFCKEEMEIVIDSIDNKALLIIKLNSANDLFLIKEEKENIKNDYFYKLKEYSLISDIGECKININFNKRIGVFNDVFRSKNTEIYFFFYYSDFKNGVTFKTKKRA